MSLTTSSKYGKISISDEAVAIMASAVASDCYGVVDLVTRRFTDNVSRIFNREQKGKGVTVTTVDNFIYVEVFVILKIGVNIEAVKKSLADAITFALEKFTGMRVKRIHVNVVGIRV